VKGETSFSSSPSSTPSLASSLLLASYRSVHARPARHASWEHFRHFQRWISLSASFSFPAVIDGRWKVSARDFVAGSERDLNARASASASFLVTVKGGPAAGNELTADPPLARP